MCTVSWEFRSDGYALFFSRDEQRSRPPAEPPTLQTEDGTRFLAPRDPLGGGTWIAANEHGLTCCLLNAYAEPWSPALETTPRSRGLLLRSCAVAGTLETLVDRLERLTTAEPWAPCVVLGIQSGEVVGRLWNGQRLSPLAPPLRPPVSTSSFQSDAVVAARHQAFADCAGDLLRFHRAPDKEADAFSVRMSRPDARTVSLTQVFWTAGNLRMGYSERNGEEGFAEPTFFQLHP